MDVGEEMEKIVIFDWVGILAHKYPDANSDRDAIIETMKYFNQTLDRDTLWNVYLESLKDENGIYISRQNDNESKIKWLNRLKKLGKFDPLLSLEEFDRIFTRNYLETLCYDDVIKYAHSLKERCKIGLFSDLIYDCYPALDKQVDLAKFDYVWLSFKTHFRKDMDEAFILVEKDTKIPPENIMFIDDTEANINKANLRGWNTCLATGNDLHKIKDAVERFLDK